MDNKTYETMILPLSSEFTLESGGEIQYPRGIDTASVSGWWGYNPVRDRELADLVGLKRVEYIDLYGTPITDAGLAVRRD